MTAKKGPLMGPVFLIFISIFSIQGGASLAKGLFPLVGTDGATALRLSFAALILCLIFRPWRTKLSRQQWLRVIAYGTSLGIMNFCFYLAIFRIPLGIAVALEFIGPLGVALLASKRALDFGVAALAAAGIFLLLPLTNISAPLNPWGVFFALAAGVCWALYIIFGQRAGETLHGGTAASLGMLVAALVILPICFLRGASPFHIVSALPLGVAVAVLSSALPYSVEMVALKKMSTHTFGILMSLEPAVAALIGFVFLKEHLTLVQWTALGCIIAASLTKSLTDRAEVKAC
jgi:inner membrane transporter RhtA